MSRLPDGWSKKPIREIGTVITGTTPATGREDFYSGPYPFVTPADLGINKYLHSASRSLSATGLANAKPLKPGAILFTCIGSTIGKMGVAGTKLATNQQINAIQCFEGVDPEYVYYSVSRIAMFIRSLAGTQAVPIVNKSTFEAQTIPLPPLPEQRKIAQILSTWDEAIALVEALIAALKRRKQGLMQRLLTGEVRFPGFEGEWQEVRLGEVFERVTRKNTIGNDNVLTASGQHGLVSQADYFNRRVASESVENYYLIERGEFAYNRSYSDGYPFGAIKRLEEYDAGVLSTLYLCFRLANEAGVGEFYKHFFEAGGMNRGIYQIAQEGARNHGLLNVGTGDFFNLEIPFPSTDEQQKLADFFNDYDGLIEATIQYAGNLREQKRGLMQRLLTGELRVRVE